MKKSNEESASTSTLSNKGDASAKQSPLKGGEERNAMVNGKVTAPPVPGFAGASQAMVGGIYKYQPIFHLPRYFFKGMEPVYEGYENFSFAELNYEI